MLAVSIANTIMYIHKPAWKWNGNQQVPEHYLSDNDQNIGKRSKIPPGEALLGNQPGSKCICDRGSDIAKKLFRYEITHLDNREIVLRANKRRTRNILFVKYRITILGFFNYNGNIFVPVLPLSLINIFMEQ